MITLVKYNERRIGEEYTTNKGYKVKIVGPGEKESYCEIEFLIDGTKRQAQYAAVKAGYVKYEGYEKLYGKDKVGEKHKTNEGFEIEVVAPGKKNSHVVVEFKEPKVYREEVQYCTVKLGTIRNVYNKTYLQDTNLILSLAVLCKKDSSVELKRYLRSSISS